MNSLTLPWPPSILSGHAKGGWRDKAQATKSFRRTAHYAALEAKWNHIIIPDGDIKFKITFTPPDNKSDRVNYVNRIKAYYDGIADALGVNDSRFCIPEFHVNPADKKSAGVVFEILDIDAQVVI